MMDPNATLPLHGNSLNTAQFHAEPADGPVRLARPWNSPETTSSGSHVHPREQWGMRSASRHQIVTRESHSHASPTQFWWQSWHRSPSCISQLPGGCSNWVHCQYSTQSSQPPPHSNPQGIAETALHLRLSPPQRPRKDMTKRDKTLESNYYSPFTPALTWDRENCMAASWRFNNATNPSRRASFEARRSRFRDIMACRPTPEPATNAGGDDLSAEASWEFEKESRDGFPHEPQGWSWEDESPLI